MSRILHLADLHLGARLTGIDRYPGAPGIDLDEAPYDAFRALMRRALSGDYDGVIIAGDVFDRGHDAERALAVFQLAIDELHEAGIPVAGIAGNHDAESSLPSRVRLTPSTTWFGADEPGTVIWDELGIAVHGQSIRERDELRELARDYPAPLAGLVNLGVLHTSLAGQWSNRVCAPATVETLDASGYDYWALGHVHERRTVSGAPPAVFPGSVHARKPEESGGRGFADVLLDGGATVTPVDTAPVRYEWLSVSAPDDLEETVLSRFDAATTLPDDAAIVWTLHGDHPENALATARDLAAGYPNYLVMRRAEISSNPVNRDVRERR